MPQHEMVFADGSNFLVPNATFIAELVAFLIILGILWRYVVPPVSKALTDRQEIIRKQMEDADNAKKALADAQTEYKKAMTEAASAGAQVREEARADAAAIREEMLARAREEADRIIASGRDQLVAERQNIVRELRSDIGSLAVELASRIVGESLADEARQRGTVERFLTEMDAKVTSQPAGRS
jgi:F-type H+-transporting ATPase subunit b